MITVSALKESPEMHDSLDIWKAGLEAVLPRNLLPKVVSLRPNCLQIEDQTLEWESVKKLHVVGFGKAGAEMAAAMENHLADTPWHDKLSGLVIVPNNAVDRHKGKIKLLPGRPPGENRPNQTVLDSSQLILDSVSSLDQDDVCIVLISGGGSALFEVLREGIDLAGYLSILKAICDRPIHEINTVRSQLSKVKSGGFVQYCHAGRVISLIISDVIGDEVKFIASGPTYLGETDELEKALSILQTARGDGKTIPDIAYFLEKNDNAIPRPSYPTSKISNVIIASNSIARAAAISKAEALGYQVDDLGSELQDNAYALGRILARRALEFRKTNTKAIAIAGGEPICPLVPTDVPRQGGRNQALALAALDELIHSEGHGTSLTGIAVLSGGTDCEDGPCDVAGALVTDEVRISMERNNLSPQTFIAINNEYPFFAKCGGHFSGPQETNVMDLMLALYHPIDC